MRPPSRCWKMKSGSGPALASPDEPARRGTRCCGNARGTPADCDRRTIEDDGSPAAAAAAAAASAIVLARGRGAASRARVPSACASSALRYRWAGVSAAAGEVEFGVAATGVAVFGVTVFGVYAASGGEMGERTVFIARETADMGAWDAGERAMAAPLITCTEVR